MSKIKNSTRVVSVAKMKSMSNQRIVMCLDPVSSLLIFGLMIQFSRSVNRIALKVPTMFRSCAFAKHNTIFIEIEAVAEVRICHTLKISNKTSMKPLANNLCWLVSNVKALDH